MRFDTTKSGEWKGKALVNDKVEKKRGIVNLNIKADESAMRIDVTSTVGTHLASVLLKGNSLEYMIVAEKTVYKTSANTTAPIHSLKIPIDIKSLNEVFFDRPPQAKTWNCARDEKGYLTTCKDSRTKTQISWVMRRGKQRTIEIDSSRVFMQVNLYDYSDSVSKPESAFHLPVPASFKSRKI